MFALVSVAVPASADDNSPVGRIAGAVDDATVRGPGGLVGGLEVTGWVTDPDRGAATTPLVFTVDDTDVVTADGSAGDAEGFSVSLPLTAGEHSVCVVATNVGEGEDTDLGCVTGTVLRQAPAPRDVRFLDEPLEFRDGIPIAPFEDPYLGVQACVDAVQWPGEVTGQQAVFVLTGEDGHRVQSPAVEPSFQWIDGDDRCGGFEWGPGSGLHPDVRYTITAQTWFDGVNPSSWSTGDQFIAATTPEQRLRADLESGALSPENYARYTVYRWFAPDVTPAQYQVPVGLPTPDLSVVMADAFSVLGENTDPAVAAELRAFFSPGGQDPGEVIALSEEDAQAAINDFYSAADTMHLGEESATAPTLGSSPATRTQGSTLTQPETTAGVSGLGGFVHTFCDEQAGVVEVPSFLTQTTDATLPCHLVTPFATINFTTTDRSQQHGVDPTDDVDLLLRAAADGGGPDGVPDEIDAIVAAYVQASSAYIGVGFPMPNRTTVDVADIRAGLSVPKSGAVFVGKSLATGSQNRSSVYVMRHELFHQFQYAYVDLKYLGLDFGTGGLTNSTTGWWLEATAEWGAHHAEEDASGYAATSPWFLGAQTLYSTGLPAHLGDPTLALTRYTSLPTGGQRQYGAFLFAEYLEQLFGPQVIAETWQTSAHADGERVIDVIADVLRNHNTSLEDVVLAYQRANYTMTTTEQVGNQTYTDPARATWAARLVDQRPGRTRVNLRPGDVVNRTASVEAGGAFYLDITDSFYEAPTYQSLDAAGVTFTVTIDATAGDVDDLAVQVEYFDSYPSICYPYDNRELTTSSGRAEHVITISPSCGIATLIISNPHAEKSVIGNFGDVSFTYRITAQQSGTGTVLEHRRGGLIHQRVNFGAGLREWLAQDDGSVALSFDLDRSVSQGRQMFTLNMFSYEYTSRATDTLIVNGTPIELAVHRSASVPDGRYLLLYGSRWRAFAVTYYLIPDGMLHDGGNVIEVPIKSSTYIKGAYVASYAP